MKELLLSGAAQIGTRLCDTALWSDRRCTWLVRITSRRADRDALEPAGHTLYGGSAGIGLFLAELHRKTGDATMHRCAEGAMLHSLDLVDHPPQYSVGLYSGVAGVAYAALRSALLLRSDEIFDRSLAVFEKVHGSMARDSQFDMIGGNAGAALALLYAANATGENRYRDWAVIACERLYSAAARLPTGWCWGAAITNTRPLAGYAHGASGIAIALIEVGVAAGVPRFEYAGLQGFNYEDSLYDDSLRNWPDFRHSGISEIFFTGGIAAVSAAARQGLLGKAHAPRAMSAWCHGAPGIALARSRASLLLGGEPSSAEKLALAQTLRAIQSGEPSNYSLCHGLAGNCDIVLSIAKGGNAPTERDQACVVLASGVERFESNGGRWLSGVFGGAADPSLLLGEAGIGLALLRAVDFDVPSVLHIAAGPSSSPANALSPERHLESVTCDIALHCGELSEMLCIPTFPSVWEEALQTTISAPPVAFATAARRLIDENEPDLQQLAGINHALRLAVARQHLLGDGLSFTNDFLEQVNIESIASCHSEDLGWRVSHRVAVVGESTGGTTLHTAHESSPNPCAVIRTGTDVHVLPLTAFAADLLALLRTPRSVSSLVESLRQHVEQDHWPAFERAVLQQLQAAIAAGIVVGERLTDQSSATSHKPVAAGGITASSSQA